MIYHIEFTHYINVAVNDGDNNDHSFIERESKLPVFLHSNIRRTERVLFPFAFEWTFKFCEDNYSDLILEELSVTESNWPLLSPELVIKYLPTMNESCDVARYHITSFVNPLQHDHTYRKFKLFESEVHDNKITLFCGGPVSAMAWLPTPHTNQNVNQVLAVSVLNSPDAKYQTYENYNENSAIQFWNFGAIVNKEFSMTEPELVFSLMHRCGPIWHMEWCPSGCYNRCEEGGISRMGLLAVTGSDSVVHIYSIPFFNKDEKGLYYKPKPVMKLLLQRPATPLLGKIKYYPTKISWSKASGHNHIAVGYTNGFVALFNLKSNSCILKYKDPDDITCLLPIKCFQAHSHAITALSLYHLNGGCRWLLTGSVDRGVSLWDLNNYSYPNCHMKKNTITDGFWLSNWLCYVTAFDEASTTVHVTTMLKQARDYLCDSNVSLTYSASTITSLTGSDWLNGVLHANSVGEIIGSFPHQLMHIPEHQKVLKTKRMLFGFTSLLEKNKTPSERVTDDKLRKKTLQNLSTKKVSQGVTLSKIKADFDTDSLFINEPIVYEEAEQKYALLFCDNHMKNYEDFPKNTTAQLSALSKSYESMLPNQYPLATVNKIVLSPNRQSSLYYATGYQAGFVRLSWLEFLKFDSQVK